MARDQYYEKVDDDDSSSDPLVGGEKSARVTRAPPTQPQKRSTLTIVAILALVTTIFLAAVAAASSAVVAYRLPSAVKAKIEAEGLSSTPTSSATPSASASSLPASDHSVYKPSEKAPSTKGLQYGDNVTGFFGKSVPMRSCGGTPDEARAAGCVFDVMMQLWTPPECMDYALSERFLLNGNWTWYADNEGKTTWNDEEIRRGNHDVVYVAQSYHRHHCIFAWERLVRAMRNQAPLIEELVSYDHVMHCRHNTLTLPSEGAQEVRGVVAPTGYTTCASYDVWLSKGLPENKMSSVDKMKRELEAWIIESEISI